MNTGEEVIKYQTGVRRHRARVGWICLEHRTPGNAEIGHAMNNNQ